MPSSFAYILNSKPFRENSLLVELFTEDEGRICCVVRPAKKRGKILKGTIQPFRYLHIQWIGKGDVQTLTDADERGRHTIPPSEMMMGLYLNELLLLLTNPHQPLPGLFSAYKYTLHKMGDASINQQIMMRFELYLLESLGYALNPQDGLNSAGELQPQIRYCFRADDGLILLKENQASHSKEPIITGEQLLALQDIQNMPKLQWKELRQFLDAAFKTLTSRTINTRRLLNLNDEFL